MRAIITPLVLWVLVGCFSSAPAFGQGYYVLSNAAVGGGNPDDLGRVDQSWTAIYNDAQTTPEWTPNQNLPFDFVIGMDTVSSFKVSNTGVITFDTSAATVPGTNNEALPSNQIPSPAITAWGEVGRGAPSNQGGTINSTIATRTVGTAPNRRFWIAFDLFGNTGGTSPLALTFFSIVLEESTNKVYFVDQLFFPLSRNASNTSMTVGIQTSSQQAYSLSNSPNYPISARSSFGSSDDITYTFTPGTQPDHDIRVIDFEVAPFVDINGSDLAIRARFQNIGSEPFRTGSFAYNINGSEQTIQINGGNNGIPSGQTAIAQFGPLWNPNAAGVYDVSVYATDVNGSPDNPSGLDTLTGTFYALENVTNRQTLYEVFTASSCPPCRPGNENLHNDIYPNHNVDEYSVIKYQMPFPGQGDPYTNLDGITRQRFYGVTSIPNVRIDGGVDINANSVELSNFNDQNAIPTAATLDVSASRSGTVLNVQVDYSIQDTLSINANNRILVAIVEDTTTENEQTNGETEFFWVEQVMLPDAEGTIINALRKGDNNTLNFSVDLDTVTTNYDESNNSVINDIKPIEDIDNMSVVAFIQNFETQEIYQSDWTFGTATGIAEAADQLNEYVVFPNPVRDYARLHFRGKQAMEQCELRVTNSLGQTVYEERIGFVAAQERQMVRLQTSSWEKGVYFVNLYNQEQMVGSTRIIR